MRRALAIVAGLVVTATASGWLYVVQPSRALPGPAIADALPLDELSRRSAVPLVIFVAVWAAAALLLGLIAHAARVERLTAAFLLAAGVGAWSYLTAGVSLLIVRQIPAHDAFHAALEIRAVYLPALLAGLGGAVLGVGRVAGRSRAPLLLSLAVAAAGVLDVMDGILPSHGRSLLQTLAPDAVHPLTSALVAPLGLALILAARGLARGRRRAWQLAVVLLAVSVALHLFEGFPDSTIVTALITLALVARRRNFEQPGDPAVRPRLVLRAALLVAVIYVYGAAALWVNRLMADQPFSLHFSLDETSRALVGLNLRGSAHLTGEFGDWFPESVLLLGLAAAGWLLVSWLAPWRYLHRQEAKERGLAHGLVQAWGADTLAPFVLRADKSYFFSEDERAFVAYRVVGSVAIVSGDPVGPPGELHALVGRFIAFARERDWRVAILGASEGFLDLYRGHGLFALYHGDEAVVDVASFSLEGRPIRKVRQSVHRLEAAGYTAEVLHPREIGPALRAELEAIARAWRGTEPERGFVMALDAFFRLEDEDAVFVIGRDEAGAAQGFLHFAVSPACSALSLSAMPRHRDTPNGFNEWLVCEAVEWARGRGFAKVSLNFAPFAALLAPEAQLSGIQKVERRALLALKGRFQLDNLLVFNRKFFPGWQRRFVVVERRRDLPRVGIAALAAESYLPFTGKK